MIAGQPIIHCYIQEMAWEVQFKMHMSAISKRLQTEVTILQKELKEVSRIHARWKKQAGRKRLILKNKIVVSTEEVCKVSKEEDKENKYKR